MTDQTHKLYSSLKSIYLHIDCQEKALLSGFNLTVVRFFILYHVNKNPGINYKELSKQLLCTKGNTTRIVTAMQDEGLITRQENPADRRSFNLSLTEKGERLYEEVNLAYHNHINGLLSKFEEDKLKIFTEVSEQIEKVITSASN